MYSFETNAVSGGKCDYDGAVTPPIFMTSTFARSEIGGDGYSYSRVSNPTRDSLQRTVALLEGGKYGFAFSSGLAAVSALFSLLKSGDRAVVSRDIYGGTYRLITEFYSKYGIEFELVDTSDAALLEKALSRETALLFVETPSNPMMKVTDLRLASRLAKKQNAFFAVDNTFLTPYYQNPLSLGADAVLHSATKYLGGHHDSTAGIIVTSDGKAAEKLSLAVKTLGAGLSPFDCFLIERGIQTLPLRMKKHGENALAVAEFLSSHRAVTAVNYPGLATHPSYELSRSQSRGDGGVMSFEVDTAVHARKILVSGKLIRFAESLGGCTSLITYPATQTHASMPKELREEAGVTNRLLRLSVGIEDVSDIIDDLETMLT